MVFVNPIHLYGKKNGARCYVKGGGFTCPLSNINILNSAYYPSAKNKGRFVSGG